MSSPCDGCASVEGVTATAPAMPTPAMPIQSRNERCADPGTLATESRRLLAFDPDGWDWLALVRAIVSGRLGHRSLKF